MNKQNFKEVTVKVLPILSAQDFLKHRKNSESHKHKIQFSPDLTLLVVKKKKSYMRLKFSLLFLWAVSYSQQLLHLEQRLKALCGEQAEVAYS